mmetsp:Transcript_10435/g.21060  ORF Transcript_10435/g.21060 Transcript_10435/m.21060 type:complete len:223 (+) Transcript_10435:1346-2014(+)
MDRDSDGGLLSFPPHVQGLMEKVVALCDTLGLAVPVRDPEGHFLHDSHLQRRSGRDGLLSGPEGAEHLKHARLASIVRRPLPPVILRFRVRPSRQQNLYEVHIRLCNGHMQGRQAEVELCRLEGVVGVQQRCDLFSFFFALELCREGEQLVELRRHIGDGGQRRFRSIGDSSSLVVQFLRLVEFYLVVGSIPELLRPPDVSASNLSVEFLPPGHHLLSLTHR